MLPIMSDTIFCQKLQKNAPKMAHPPFPGVLGEKIHHNISVEAWNLWLEQQTKIINENRLSPLNPEHKAQLTTAMQQFLFNE